MTRAMVRPSYRSRTMETASTRVQALPRPWPTRAMISVSKVGARVASRLNST